MLEDSEYFTFPLLSLELNQVSAVLPFLLLRLHMKYIWFFMISFE